MFTAVQISSAQHAPAAIPAAQLSDKALGILFASVIPAVFWTAIVALVGAAIGQSPSLMTLATIGTSITVFLAVVVGSLMARRT